MRLLPSLLLFVLSCSFLGCKPDDEKLNMSPSLKLSFSRDTIFFDTVFTQTGSVTKRLWVFNKDRNAVNIERIELARASGEQYSLIINGQETNATTNVRLRGEDSMLVLVKVRINPSDENQPFIVTDSIRFTTNGNQQDVKLRAYGQNAYFHRGSYDEITVLENCPGEVIWLADKPHVIYGAIGVPQGCTLTIQEGARVFSHANSGIYVGGTLQVQGTANKRVSFQGDRREERYNDRPGQWTGIIFAENLVTRSSIRFADIKNAVYGTYIGSNNSDGNFDLLLEHCDIRNMLAYGLISFFSDVKADNCLFFNAGEAAVATFKGGTYEFQHCTIYNDGRYFIHDKPSARFESRTKINGVPEEQPLNLKAVNSIIWGTIADEVFFDPGLNPDPPLQLANNLVRTEAYQSVFSANGGLVSQLDDYPKFLNVPEADFRPDSSASPAVGAGLLVPGITTDLLGKIRPFPAATWPDIGAFEVQQP